MFLGMFLLVKFGTHSGRKGGPTLLCRFLQFLKKNEWPSSCLQKPALEMYKKETIVLNETIFQTRTVGADDIFEPQYL
jgi:hypothetical protein